ncbi:succinate dehydrogenase, hydrophobic membrane anchor protein [Luteimonas sp. RD2P54]|uniref:Succinate dehydrogenase hydrophobic membrane anchor subunit n=1 Tax=Luteimonas endophytica TaxID=3042023 RepID=A0ABT6JC15_9GAMM|nr:succinate dehydrogenase, hydrophobic membrane anchor protein [Luteimonas endophytica]MDH5824367.1 succinate dehydrogenase, hydrophobic membrane anchor protein [Luteimonas endophytica]
MNEAKLERAPARRDFRSPIGRARGMGSAKSGTGHFWWQRVTAVVLALLVPWLVGTLVSLIGADLETVRGVLARPWNATLLAVFVLSMFWHTQMGLQVVIEDYVHARAVEVALQLLVTFLCVVASLAALYAIGRIAFLA